MRGSGGSIVIAIGVVSIVLYGVGLTPLYIQAWKHKGRVVGLSTNNIESWSFIHADSYQGWTFLATDIAGGFLCLMALAAQHTFDVLGGTAYILVLTMESGIGFVQLVWLWRTRKVRAEAKAVGMDYDEYISKEDTNENASEKSEAPENMTPITTLQKVLVHGN